MAGMQVLLIDDNDIDNAVNAKLLQLAKISDDITTFTDPMKALRHLATVGSTWTSPRHILLDIRMPNMDGFEWLDAFRQLPDDIQAMCRVFMLTASINRDELDQAEHDDTVIALLEKPLDVYVFKQLLDL